jgi:CRP-like cAMP-binding protein
LSQAAALDAATVVYELPAQSMRALVAAHPCLAAAVLDRLGQHIGALCDRVEDLACYRVRTRLARTLARSVAAEPAGVVWETRAELAALIGTREEKVCKELKKLRTLGLIDYQPRRQGIRVCDPAALMQV